MESASNFLVNFIITLFIYDKLRINKSPLDLTAKPQWSGLWFNSVLSLIFFERKIIYNFH